MTPGREDFGGRCWQARLRVDSALRLPYHRHETPPPRVTRMNRPFLLDDARQARLTKLASQKQQTEEQLLQEAVRDEQPEDGRAGFLAEAEQSWQDYQADGLHLSGDEARAWLRSWGSPDEKAPPYA